MTDFESCIYCKHDGPPHATTMAQSTKHHRRCTGCPQCQAEITAENEAVSPSDGRPLSGPQRG
jgi:hypothetical protein